MMHAGNGLYKKDNIEFWSAVCPQRGVLALYQQIAIHLKVWVKIKNDYFKEMSE